MSRRFKQKTRGNASKRKRSTVFIAAEGHVLKPMFRTLGQQSKMRRNSGSDALKSAIPSMDMNSLQVLKYTG